MVEATGTMRYSETKRPGATRAPIYRIVAVCSAVMMLVVALQALPPQNVPAPPLVAQPRQEPGFQPKNGFVPDAQTAIKIALAVWEPIYGADQIARQKPYRARLENRVWTVEGSLPAGWLGGVALAEIAQDDGRILRVIHEQ